MKFKREVRASSNDNSIKNESNSKKKGDETQAKDIMFVHHKKGLLKGGRALIKTAFSSSRIDTKKGMDKSMFLHRSAETKLDKVIDVMQRFLSAVNTTFS